MKDFLRRVLNGIMSVVTMALIMLSPVAAIIYAADLPETSQHVSLNDKSFSTDVIPSSAYEQPASSKNNPEQLQTPSPFHEKLRSKDEYRTLR
jgi:hypothetical protein